MRQAAVLGSPIRHSLSPALHRAAYRVLGLDWSYEAIELTQDQLPDFVRGRDDTWVGLSLTMPLKVAVLELLDQADPLVEQTSAANTVVFREGRRIGYNTDVFGIEQALREAGTPVSGSGPVPSGLTATVIGAGATARSAVAALAGLGVSRLRVVARRPAAAAKLGRFAAGFGIDAEANSWSDARTALAADLVVSTVPVGAVDALADSVSGQPGILLDVVYDPWPTPIAQTWASAGGKVVSGLSMLVWQAAEQVCLMTGQPAPVDAMRQAGASAASH